MGFIRRLLGGGQQRDGAQDSPSDADTGAAAAPPAEDDAERAHELEVLREDQARLDDLARRQLKYARYSWQPPSQGGDRRADDADEAR